MSKFHDEARPGFVEQTLDRVYRIMDAVRGGEDECWIWPGIAQIFSSTTGRVVVEDKMCLVARLTLERELGRSIPGWAKVYHSCSNHPLCVNPKHIYEVPLKPPKKKLTKEERAAILNRNLEKYINSPENKERARRLATPEHLKELHDTWARSPENRERMRRLATPEHLKKLHNTWSRSPENRERMRRLGGRNRKRNGG